MNIWCAKRWYRAFSRRRHFYLKVIEISMKTKISVPFGVNFICVCVFSCIHFSVTCLEMISFFRQIGRILKNCFTCVSAYLSKKVKDTDIHLTSVLFCTLNGSTIDVETSSSKIFVRTTFVPLFFQRFFFLFLFRVIIGFRFYNLSKVHFFFCIFSFHLLLFPKYQNIHIIRLRLLN